MVHPLKILKTKTIDIIDGPSKLDFQLFFDAKRLYDQPTPFNFLTSDRSGHLTQIASLQEIKNPDYNFQISGYIYLPSNPFDKPQACPFTGHYNTNTRRGRFYVTTPRIIAETDLT